MKILLVSLHLVEYAVELANGLAAANEVHLVLSANRVARTLGGEFYGKLDDSIKCTLINKRSIWSAATWRSIWSVFKMLRTWDYDIVHLQECGNPLNLLFLLFARKPVVITIHDVTLHPGHEASSVKTWRLWVRGKLIKYGYKKVIVHGENLKKMFLDHYEKPPRDVFAVPHGCLFSFVNGKKRQPAEEEPHTVLFFGRMEKYKGLKFLIDTEPLVSKRLPDFKIIVAGAGDDLELHRKALLASPHFELHDHYIPNPEVPALFERASAVVLPYIEASQSGIAAMAFAFGKPVIATDVGSLSELVHDGKTGRIVPAKDREKLADAIVDLLENREKRFAMGREASRLAHTELGWRNIAQLTLNVYKDALN